MEDVGKGVNELFERRNFQQKYDEMMQEVLADPTVKKFLAENKDKLTQADVKKSYPKLYEFVQEKRKFTLNDPTMMAPGYEPRLVLNFHYIDVAYVPTEDLLERRKQEEIKNRVSTIDIPKDIRNANMKNFDKTDAREEALFETMKFVKNYTENVQAFHKGLYLAGDFGVGKTYLLGAMANELAKRGYTSMMVHMPTFTSMMKSSVADNTVAEKLENVKKPKILILDDVGADALTAWTRDEIFGVILQYRMQEQLPTFFTSNFTMDGLENHLRLTKTADEPLKAKRIMERIRYLAKEIIMSGPNRRNE